MLGGKKIVGLCLTRINTPEMHKMITTLNDELRDDGYSVFVYSTATELYWNTPSEIGEKSVFELVDFDVVDVLVIMYETIKDRELSGMLIRKAQEKGIPVFVVTGHCEGCININFDYKGGFERIVRHVIETHAVRKPHFMAGIMGNSFSEERLEMFKEVIAEFGIPFDDSMVSYGDFWSRPTIDATEKLIASGDLPEAIICANDTMAVTVCAVLKNHCISVPDEVIVTGFDGIDDVAIVSPTISTYTCSTATVAENIAEIIRSGEFPSGGADIDILPAESLGQSCGCERESHLNLTEHLTVLNDRFNRYQGEENHLFRMAAKISTSADVNEISTHMCQAGFYDMTCILRKECIDNTVNPLDMPRYFDKKNALVLFDADVPANEFRPYEFRSSDVVPDLQKLLDAGDPLIFIALSFLHIPLGYLCYHFHNNDMENYFTILQTVNIMNSALGAFRNMRYQQYLNNRLEEIYKMDRLTGLYNRNALVNGFEEMSHQACCAGQQITFVLSDLDRLKYINDTFGHAEGDFAIRAVADALRSVCPDNSLLARWGGDEMVAVFRGDCDAEKLKADISAALERIRVENDKPYEITSSVGVVSTAFGKEETLDEITKRADQLMYKEKVEKRKQRA